MLSFWFTVDLGIMAMKDWFHTLQSSRTGASQLVAVSYPGHPFSLICLHKIPILPYFLPVFLLLTVVVFWLFLLSYSLFLWRSSSGSLLVKSFLHEKSTYEVHTISFQTFFIWALLLIVYTWNSSPLRSNLLRLIMHLYHSNNFWKAPWKSSSVSVSMTFVTASFISSIVS